MLHSLVSSHIKAQYLKWFMNSFKLVEETQVLLRILMNRPSYLEKIRISDRKVQRWTILIYSSTGIFFVLGASGNVRTKQVDEVLKIIGNLEDSIDLIPVYATRPSCVRFQSVCETNLQATTHIEDRVTAAQSQYIIDTMERLYKRNFIMSKVNDALDQGDEHKFALACELLTKFDAGELDIDNLDAKLVEQHEEVAE